MRLHEIEEQWNHQTLLDFLQDNCGPFLSIINHRPFYRGMNYSTDVVIKNVRTDRKPLSTHPIVQKLLDEYLLKHNIHALRSNSIFTSTHYLQTAPYGPIHYIFPIGEFNFCFSETTADLYSVLDLDDLIYYLNDNTLADINELSAIRRNDGTSQYRQSSDAIIRELATHAKLPKSDFIATNIDTSKLNGLFDKCKFNNTNLLAAFNGKEAREVLFNCKEYVAVLKDSSLGEYVGKWFIDGIL